MSITLADLDFLTSDAGQRVLARLAADDLSDERALPLLTALRRDFGASQAGAALELARLRKKAVAKFGDDAAKLYFTRDALEQASDPLVRRYRTGDVFSGQHIVDACCGIGADSIAFGQAGGSVTGLDIDPMRVAMARLNAQALGVTARFEVADVRNGVPDADLIFFDPGRRDENGKRIFDVERYQPPLKTIRGWRAPRIIVKLSPGVDLAQVEPYIEDDGHVVFVSVAGDLKEALLIRGDNPAGAAVLLTADATHIRGAHAAVTGLSSEPRNWLVEPDPAIIRAGLVEDLALELGGALLDPEIAYITTDIPPDTPWARAWRILDWMPFNLKKLRAYLREQDVGRVTVKKRGTAVTPEELIRKLKLNGSGSRTIVLTRCRGEHVMLVCEDLTVEGGG
ncbi:MAG: methyltransferase domain-containing protein [Anaerolineae bacterium]|nr:methyltransferase domain-containing protein [Anaerolineae bacterium]